MTYWITPAVALISAALLSFNNCSFDNLPTTNHQGEGPAFDVAVAPEPNNSPEFYVPPRDSDPNPKLPSNQPSSIPSNCKWTGCEGVFTNGQVICNNYRLGWYMYMNTAGCGSFTAKHLCCKATAGAPKRWSSYCYGTAYSNKYVCNKEFGLGFVPTGTARSCSGIAMTQYECTN